MRVAVVFELRQAERAGDSLAVRAVFRSKWAWLWPIAVAALVILASSRSRVAGPEITNIDKVAHFSVFGLIATLVCRMRSPAWRWALTSLAIASAFGVTDEWHQSYVPGRSPDVGDWIADTSGAALAIALYTGWRWYRELLEFSLWPWRGGKTKSGPTP